MEGKTSQLSSNKYDMKIYVPNFEMRTQTLVRINRTEDINRDWKPKLEYLFQKKLNTVNYIYIKNSDLRFENSLIIYSFKTAMNDIHHQPVIHHTPFGKNRLLDPMVLNLNRKSNDPVSFVSEDKWLHFEATITLALFWLRNTWF